MRRSATKGGSMENISSHFEIKYISENSFTFKIWISGNHITEYLFEDNGQRLISRRETHRYGKAKYKRGELKTEKEMWAAFKQELDDMPIRDVINIPHKYLKLYLWKYPVRSQDITRRTQRYPKKPKLQCV